MIVQRTIDMKHSIRATLHGEPELTVSQVDLELIKHENNTVIPETEPTILFRGRDKLALPMLNYYKELCEKDGATPHQLESIQTMIDKFFVFAADNPQTMKQPGSTLGK